MKKFLTVLLVLCLVLTGLSAGSFRAGAELGWGFDIAKYKGSFSLLGYSYEIEQKIKNNGFSANIVGEYDFTKNIGIKASAGMMIAGKAKGEVKKSATGEDGDSTEMKGDKSSGLWLDFAFDGKFTFPVNEKFSISGLTGLELMYGALMKEDGVSDDYLKKMKNLAFGANIGVEVSYMVIENLRINAGVTGAWFFVNKCDFIDEQDKAYKDATSSWKSSKSSFYIRPYVGATYAF